MMPADSAPIRITEIAPKSVDAEGSAGTRVQH
jgi:hypothetical protein